MEEDKRKAPRIPYWGDDVPDPKPLPVSGKDILNGILPGCSMSLVWLCMSYLNIYDDLEGCAELLFSTATLERWLQAVDAKEEKDKAGIYSRLIAQGQVCCWFDRPAKEQLYTTTTDMRWTFNGVPFRLFDKPTRVSRSRGVDGSFSDIIHEWFTPDGLYHSDKDRPSVIQLSETRNAISISMTWYQEDRKGRKFAYLPSVFRYRRLKDSLERGLTQWENTSLGSPFHALIFELWVRPHLPDGWINFMPEYIRPATKAEIERQSPMLLDWLASRQHMDYAKELGVLISKLNS